VNGPFKNLSICIKRYQNLHHCHRLHLTSRWSILSATSLSHFLISSTFTIPVSFSSKDSNASMSSASVSNSKRRSLIIVRNMVKLIPLSVDESSNEDLLWLPGRELRRSSIICFEGAMPKVLLGSVWYCDSYRKTYQDLRIFPSNHSHSPSHLCRDRWVETLLWTAGSEELGITRKHQKVHGEHETSEPLLALWASGSGIDNPGIGTCRYEMRYCLEAGYTVVVGTM